MGFLGRLFGGGAGGDPPAVRSLVEQSMEELRVKTAAHDAGWRLGEADWNVDQDAGTIVFTRRDGITAIGPVQIIGTYNTKDGTWLWGWDHPSVEPALQEHAGRVRESVGNNLASCVWNGDGRLIRRTPSPEPA